MCFGNSYKESTKLESGSGVRETYESNPAGLCGGCFDDEEIVVASRPRVVHPTYRVHQRYGAGPTSYYPAHYYAAPPGMVRPVPSGVYYGGIGYGGGRYVGGGRVALPSPPVLPWGSRSTSYKFDRPTTTPLASHFCLLLCSAMEQRHALPKPRHSYTYVPQPGRRGVLVHNGQINNGAPPTGVYPGGIGYSAGYVPPYAAGYGVHPGGVGYYPGVYGSLYHTRPHYYGPNTHYSTYSRNYWNYPSSYYNFPTYRYYSPYATYGVGCGTYANYYFPYQRTYYTPGVAAAPGYSYAYQTMAPAVAVVNPQAPVPPHPPVAPVAAPAPVNAPVQPGPPLRSVVEHQNQVEAARSGAYAPRYIKPAHANDNDRFWCQEATGEWHLRSYYQIERECQPGEWLMNPDFGFLCFHRR
ncbi:hypothetical protein DM02DRAFT_625009 [Periconia macrospinosa]|uniref:Uncharacterized protein n=1 Tax=Periconia macrospinosa TaxID=97972 RepID=A0A2V1E1K5_9PLEO|nr:hypothetical protein DM02DRAFT_625009 [Periconia macrospinosa]